MYSRAYVEITNICNKSCSFCIGHRRPPGRRTEAEFRAVAEQLCRVTGFVYYHVMGEPLTHPLIGDFIKISSSLGLKSVVTTNGTLLERRGDELISAGVYKVNISLHSFEDGTAEEYEKYVDTCLDFADKASRAGVLCVIRLWNNGHDGGRNQDIIDRMKKKFFDGEWQVGARGTRIRPRLHLEHGDRFEWPDMSADDGGENVFCYALRDHFSVLCDGTVIPCCLDHDRELALGNIFEQNIEDILSSPRAKRIFDGFTSRTATEELCRKCGYARRFK